MKKKKKDKEKVDITNFKELNEVASTSENKEIILDQTVEITKSEDDNNLEELVIEESSNDINTEMDDPFKAQNGNDTTQTKLPEATCTEIPINDKPPPEASESKNIKGIMVF